MQKKAVIDSGPLIALFDKDDQWHREVISFLKHYDGKLCTTIAVITEVTHLLDFNIQVQLDFLRWISQGAVEIVDIKTDDVEDICTLTNKYSDLPMDFADASLVQIAEKLNIENVVSIDKDFYIYRTLSNGYLSNLLTQNSE